MPMVPVRCSAKSWGIIQSVIMTSHYFAQSRSVVSRRGIQNADCKPATSLRSKLTIKSEKVDLVCSSAAVKLEEEEAKISGNVYLLVLHMSYFCFNLCRSSGFGSRWRLLHMCSICLLLVAKAQNSLSIFTLECITIGNFCLANLQYDHVLCFVSVAGSGNPVKTEADAPTLRSHSRRRRQLKVEYEKDGSDPQVKTELWEPPDWKKQLGYIRDMRSSRDAPVDNMGADKCYDADAPAHVGVCLRCLFLSKSVYWLTGICLLASSAGTGEAVPGFGLSNVVQSN